MREVLAFAAFFAGFDPARVPLLVFGMRSAKPALAIFAEERSGFVAGFVHRRNSFTGSLRLFLAKRFPCRLRFHAAPRCPDCTPCCKFEKQKYEEKHRAHLPCGNT